MIHSKIQLGLALMIALSSLCLGVSALHFEMVYQTKCVFEEVDFESSIAGYFKAFHKHDPRSLVPCDLVIEDPEGQEVFRSTGRAEESFYLSDAKEGEYKLCWTVQGGLSCDHHHLIFLYSRRFACASICCNFFFWRLLLVWVGVMVGKGEI